MRLRLPLLSLLLAAFTVTACSAITDEADEESLLDDVDPGVSSDDEPTASVSSELYGCNQCSNCVKYARCRQPRLPYGLFSYQDKVRRINSQTARAGCVAVIRSGSSWGHVAYVRAVRGGTIHIDEGNWPSGRCGTRSGTKASLRISGFICP